jgi:hypothetical protein
MPSTSLALLSPGIARSNIPHKFPGARPISDEVLAGYRFATQHQPLTGRPGSVTSSMRGPQAAPRLTLLLGPAQPPPQPLPTGARRCVYKDYDADPLVERARQLERAGSMERKPIGLTGREQRRAELLLALVLVPDDQDVPDPELEVKLRGQAERTTPRAPRVAAPFGITYSSSRAAGGRGRAGPARPSRALRGGGPGRAPLGAGGERAGASASYRTGTSSARKAPCSKVRTTGTCSPGRRARLRLISLDG